VSLAFATLAVVARTYQFAVLDVEPGYAKGNFFSFFTIQSNILAVAALFLLVAVPRNRRAALFEGRAGGRARSLGREPPGARVSTHTRLARTRLR